MMMDKCYPFMGLYKMSQEDMRIGFLMSLARPGDGPLLVEANSKLTDMYVDVIMKARKRKKLEGDINEAKENLNEKIRREKSISDDIVKANSSLDEIDKILSTLLDGDLAKKPESNEGRRIANERIYAERCLKDLEVELKDCQERKASLEKRIEDMTKELQSLS